MNILVFVLVLTVLVLVHELGHFLVARFFKMKVEEFGFGFPLTRPIFSTKRRETKYSFYPLLIGGFVKLYGEDEAGAGRISSKLKSITDKSSAFYTRPAWQKFITIVAGVVMNFILAAVLVSLIYATSGVPELGNNVVIDDVIKGSPAELSGIRKEDVVEKINGRELQGYPDLINETKKHLGEEVTLQIKRGDEVIFIKVTPRKVFPKGQGAMGIVLKSNIEINKHPWYLAPIAGFNYSIKTTLAMFNMLGSLVGQIFSTGTVPQGAVGGPVAVARLTSLVCTDIPSCVFFASNLSLNLGVLNVLPIPALDGGRLLFIVISVVTRRKVNAKLESYAHSVGLILLLALLAMITFQDLLRLFTGQPILPR